MVETLWGSKFKNQHFQLNGGIDTQSRSQCIIFLEWKMKWSCKGKETQREIFDPTSNDANFNTIPN